MQLVIQLPGRRQNAAPTTLSVRSPVELVGRSGKEPAPARLDLLDRADNTATKDTPTADEGIGDLLVGTLTGAAHDGGIRLPTMPVGEFKLVARPWGGESSLPAPAARPLSTPV
jgi:hypothetical protein